MSERHSFFAELKRRNVYKVAIAYAVVGWLLIQVATQVFPFFEIPNWAVRLVVLAIVAGFPIALVIAWAFELTPQGLETYGRCRSGRARKQETSRLDLCRDRGSCAFDRIVFVGRYTARNTVGTTSELPPRNQSPCCHSIILSRDPDNAYFAEGVQDEILTRLAKVADLKVISRTSTQTVQKRAGRFARRSRSSSASPTFLKVSVQKVQRPGAGECPANQCHDRRASLGRDL